MNNRYGSGMSFSGAMRLLSLAVALLVVPLSLVPVPAGAVETDRLTVEEPGTGTIKFKVTSDGNVTATSYAGDGAALANVPHWKGAWNSATAYVKDDCVFHNGSSWIALQGGTNLVPVANPAYWSVMAQQGPAGANGSTGSTGATGAQGPQGATGPQGPAGSPDTQTDILGKVATATDGATFLMQQGATEAITAVKFAIKDNTGRTRVSMTPSGTLGLGTSTPARAFELVADSGAASYSATTAYRTGPYAGGFIFSHARGSAASPTYLNLNDRIGSMFFKAYDGTNPNPSAQESAAASIEVFTESAFSTYSPGYIVFSTSPALTKDPIERLRVTSTGNIGIGTTTPSQKIEVNGGVRINTATAKPACDSTVRGTFWVTQGSPDDLVEVCAMVSGSLVWKALW
jgi:hypothetical protein